MFRAVKENIELRKEIQEQDRQYNLLLTKFNHLEKQCEMLQEEIKAIEKTKENYLKRIKKMREELKELKNEKNNWRSSLYLFNKKSQG